MKQTRSRPAGWRRATALVGICLGVTTRDVCAQTPSTPTPWRLHDALGLPAWLTLGFEHRTRFETIDNQFRKDGSGGDQAIAFRTLASVEAKLGDWRVGGEFIDARVTGDDAGTPMDNTLINETEMLQAYIDWETKNFLGCGLGFSAKLGRQTLDLGNRRLVARNAFRNTINAFTGIDAIVTAAENWIVNAFFFLPDFRLPSDVDELRAERSVLDREDPNNYFWGVYGTKTHLPLATTAELYVFGLHENDEPSLATRDRHLYTPGLRWHRDPAPGEWDLEIEAAYQLGTSRASTKSTDVATLNHVAHFEHAQLGYTFRTFWTPRVVAQYDYASGDDNPNDGSNNRFDTLFGARRFEFGPTGIWGAFARSNINSPGYRVIVKPTASVTATLAHRAFWLASRRDAWTTTPVSSSGVLQDPAGRSGDFVGQQIEAWIAWAMVPKNVTVEAGWAHLIKGEFARNAPGVPNDRSDSDYFYAQTTLLF